MSTSLRAALQISPIALCFGLASCEIPQQEPLPVDDLNQELVLTTPTVKKCPTGYRHDTKVRDIVVCKFGKDEVVRVGTGATAFWIDRYEASVWRKPPWQIGAMDTPAPNLTGVGDFQPDGDGPVLYYAGSVRDVGPSGSANYLMANQACRMSGKRLATADEWLFAARGTQAVRDQCALTGGLGAIKATNVNTGCVSIWGAEDMIGNLWEIVHELYGAPSNDGAVNNTAPFAFMSSPTNSNNGARIAGLGHRTNGGSVVNGTIANMPGASLRGGSADPFAGDDTGQLSQQVSGYTASYTSIGFRCVIPN